MKIIYEKRFLKDLEWLDKNISIKLQENILNIKSIDNLKQIKNLKKLSWFSDFYRIRISDFRLWLKFKNNEIIFIRFKHRKDIYKIFP